MTASARRAAGDGRPGLLDRLAAALAAQRPWPRFGWAFLLGFVSSLAMPPAHAVPVLLATVPGLLWLLAGVRTGRGAFACCWAFAFGLLLAGLYWIAFALTVDLASYWWMIPFAAAGLPAGLGLLYATAGWLAWRLAPPGLGRALLFAALWATAEWLRGHILTGFPWNLTGAGWSGWPAMLQGVAWIGIYGLSALTILAAAAVSALAGPGSGVPGRRPAVAVAALSVGALVLVGAAGAVRLSGASGEMVPGVVLRLVQPSFSQEVKNDPGTRFEQLETQLAMSRRPALGAAPTHVIWAETAVPYLIEPEGALAQALGGLVGPEGIVLVGAVSLDEAPGGAGEPDFYNSVLALGPEGQLLGRFDKAHLVPFGEYVPLRGILPIERITPGIGDYSAGPGPRTLDLPGLPPVGPLICYEVIFPGAVVDRTGPRPHWLLNLTNDGWYGRTAGPHQHFEIARTRAVEEGLPLVRVAMNGVTGVVDSWGRTVARLDLDVTGIVDAPLPVAGPPTLYTRIGDTAFWTIVALALAGGLLAGRLGRSRHKPLHPTEPAR